MRLMPALAFAALLTSLNGCSVQSSALPPESDGGMDAGFDSNVPDGRVPDVTVDASVRCTEFSEPHVVAVVSGDALLTAMGVVYDETEVEEPGNVALRENRYRYGAWAVDGHDAELLGDPPNLADLGVSVPTARAFRSVIDRDVAAGEAPYELLIDSDDSYTLEVAGEIQLSAGDNDFRITVNDRAVFAVDVDGTSVAVRRVDPGEATMTVTAPLTGWYPVHGAWQNSGGDGAFALSLAPPGESLRNIRPSEMRVEAAMREGREVFGWDTEVPSGFSIGSRIDADETRWSSSAAYPGVGLPGMDNWSVRWSGQHLFADPIDDVLVASNDGHRLFVDGVFHGGGFGGAASVGYDTQAADGMIDVVLELTDRSSGAAMELTYDEAVFQPPQLRPYTRFGGVPHGRGQEFAHAISSTRTETLDLSTIPAGPPSAVEVSVVIAASDPNAVTVTVTAPSGEMDSEPLTNAAWSRAAGLWLLRWVPPWAGDLSDADGVWEITVDNSGSTDVTWSRQGVLVHLGGVREPYPPRGSFRTAFIDLGDESEITGVRAGGVVNGQTDVSFAIRAGATPTDAAMLPFTDTDALGDLPSPLTARFFQVEARLSGPGWDTPRIRDLRIVGRTCRRCAEVDPATCPEERVADGLIALWAFEEGGGGFARDLSGYRVHDLIAPSAGGFRWGPDYVAIDGALFRVDRPIAEIREAMADMGGAASGLTVEAWLRPANDTQNGPASIVTISESTGAENLTLAQDADVYQARIRHGVLRTNYPETEVDSVVAGRLQHVVTTRAPDGTAQMWLDGVENGVAENNPGTFEQWDPDFRLYVGNQNLGGRPWSGEIHLIAIYRRALSAAEIALHHRVGPQRRPLAP